MMYVRAVRLENFAGYAEIVWEDLLPGTNFLFGKNGSGKSTILQAIDYCLDYHANRRRKDVFNVMYPTGRVILEVSEPGRRLEASVELVQQSMGMPPEPLPISVLEMTENRQPKTRIGVGRAKILDSPGDRYSHTMSELQALIRLGGDSAPLVDEVFDLCSRVPEAGRPEDWERIRETLARSGRRQGRPMSCGQHDLLALIFDLVRFRNTVERDRSVFILLDNPSVFLHPACEVRVVQLVEQMFPEAQVFVASHSLKLLTHAKPKSVFWVNRETRSEGDRARIECVRELETGAKNLFFDLYGTDVSSAVLILLRAYESPEYYRYLLDCALPPQSALRKHPEKDRQMVEVRRVIGDHELSWRVLDFGAGHGDLLEALLVWDDGGPGLTYVALDPQVSAILLERLAKARSEGRVSEGSVGVASWDAVPGDFDVVMLCNVCHEILPPELPWVLARLLVDHLSDREGSRLIIHEVETLSVGETEFLMWRPEEYETILTEVGGFRVETVFQDLPGTVRLGTAIVSRSDSPRNWSVVELASALEARFAARLALKKREYLREAKLLRRRSGDSTHFEGALRQRRLAFLTAQLATICELEIQREGDRRVSDGTHQEG